MRRKSRPLRRYIRSFQRSLFLQKSNAAGLKCGALAANLKPRSTPWRLGTWRTLHIPRTLFRLQLADRTAALDGAPYKKIKCERRATVKMPKATATFMGGLQNCEAKHVQASKPPSRHPRIGILCPVAYTCVASLTARTNSGLDHTADRGGFRASATLDQPEVWH